MNITGVEVFSCTFTLAEMLLLKMMMFFLFFQSRRPRPPRSLRLHLSEKKDAFHFSYRKAKETSLVAGLGQREKEPFWPCDLETRCDSRYLKIGHVLVAKVEDGDKKREYCQMKYLGVCHILTHGPAFYFIDSLNTTTTTEAEAATDSEAFHESFSSSAAAWSGAASSSKKTLGRSRSLLWTS